MVAGDGQLVGNIHVRREDRDKHGSREQHRFRVRQIDQQAAAKGMARRDLRLGNRLRCRLPDPVCQIAQIQPANDLHQHVGPGEQPENGIQPDQRGECPAGGGDAKPASDGHAGAASGAQHRADGDDKRRAGARHRGKQCDVEGDDVLGLHVTGVSGYGDVGVPKKCFVPVRTGSGSGPICCRTDLRKPPPCHRPRLAASRETGRRPR